MRSKQTSRQILNLLVGYLDMVLGTTGMGLVWRYANTLWLISRSVDNGLVMLTIAMWALLSMAFINRAICFPVGALREMRHPVSSSFVSPFLATTLLVVIRLTPWQRPLVLGLFVLRVALQLAYTVQQSSGLRRGMHLHGATTPGLYLLMVTSNSISAMVCGALGSTDAGLAFLGAEVFFWLSLEPAILQRLHSVDELPMPLRTSLGIQLAPALAVCSAWLSVNGGEADTSARLLFGYGLLQLLFMLRLMPWYLRQPLSTSFWNFSSGISAPAATSLHLSQARVDGFFRHLATPLLISSNLAIGLLLLHTILLLVSGELLAQANRETPLNKKEGS